MSSLPKRIVKLAAELPEGALLSPGALLHLGTRAAIDQALSRLARKGDLLRVCQGLYVRPIQTRFGPRPPAVEKVIASLSDLWGETIVPCGGRSGECPWTHHTGAGAVGLSDLGPRSQAVPWVSWQLYCAMLRVGSWQRRTDQQATWFAPCHGWVRTKLRRPWT